MGKIIQRRFNLHLPESRSAFLWGPRKVGKSFWVKNNLKNVPVIDLLKTDVFADFATRPFLLRERFAEYKGLIVIDEIQKVPMLLDEVHWMIENRPVHFLLTGSSARKLKRAKANMLGGRAWRKVMVPLCSREAGLDALEDVIISGLMPSHYLSPNPIEDLRGYVADYLKEEVAEEAETRNLPTFAEFLRIAALTSSELLNYVNLGRECGISHKTIRNYFQILEDTYLAVRLSPWKHSKNRRMTLTEKFYLFDVGVANYLARRQPKMGTPEFGKSFEHLIFMELRAYQAYVNPDLPLYFWRTSAGHEVDFILGQMECAVEVKSSARIYSKDLHGMLVLSEEHMPRNKMIVCLEKEKRVLESGIQILPWQQFLDKLWGNELTV